MELAFSVIDLILKSRKFFIYTILWIVYLAIESFWCYTILSDWQRFHAINAYLYLINCSASSRKGGRESLELWTCLGKRKPEVPTMNRRNLCSRTCPRQGLEDNKFSHLTNQSFRVSDINLLGVINGIVKYYFYHIWTSSLKFCA